MSVPLAVSASNVGNFVAIWFLAEEAYTQGNQVDLSRNYTNWRSLWKIWCIERLDVLYKIHCFRRRLLVYRLNFWLQPQLPGLNDSLLLKLAIWLNPWLNECLFIGLVVRLPSRHNQLVLISRLNLINSSRLLNKLIDMRKGRDLLTILIHWL